MKKFRGYIEKLKGYTPAKQKEDILKIIKHNEKFIVDLNRNQLLKGIDSQGSKLLEYESEEYAEMKRKLNPLGVTDLKLTGKFHKGMYLKIENGVAVFGSTDSKTQDLVNKYGSDIFGLTQESKELLEAIKLREDALRLYKKIYGVR
jgi:hypothetical protein